VRALGFAALAAAVFVVGGATARTDQRPVLTVALKSSGKVTTSDGRLGCRGHCSARYRRGRVLTLTATPDPNFLFDHWEGACIGKAPICDVALDRDTSVRARFVGVPTRLWLVVGGPGRIISDKGGMDCGEASTACTVELPHASHVTLTPVAGSGGRFGAWDGPCASAGTAACIVRIASPSMELAAAFGHSAPEPGPQTLSIRHEGSALVRSDPPGIHCPDGPCAAAFPSGTPVTLLRVGSVWRPPCTSSLYGPDRCLLVVDAPTEVLLPPPPPPPPPPPTRPFGELQITVSGGGLVSASDADISCGWIPTVQNACSERFVTLFTQTRHLRAVSNGRLRFVRWGGLCHGTKPTCTLHMKRKANERFSTFPVTALYRRSHR
jgi:Divergent InlB B-repeat domain